MRIYEHFQISDSCFSTAKKFLTIKLICDETIQNKNLIIKSFKAYTPNRIVLYDDFLEHEVTFIHTAREHEWVFDYAENEIVVIYLER